MPARDTTAQGCWCVRVGTVPDSLGNGEGGETSEAYLCLQQRENCCAPCCVNAMDVRAPATFAT